MSDTSPTLSHMEDALAHYGVRGMRWGVRKSESDSSGGMSKTQLKSAAITAGKIAYQAGKLGAVPAAAALGVGLPAIAGFKIGEAVLSDPTVQSAIKAAGSYSKALVKEIGDVKLPDMPKVSNPFSVKTVPNSDKWFKVVDGKKVPTEAPPSYGVPNSGFKTTIIK